METKLHGAKVVANASATTGIPIEVCMHVLKSARNDVRVVRAATALVEAGYSVSIVDVEAKRNGLSEEELLGMRIRHVMMPASFINTRFSRWALFRTVQVLIYSILKLLKTPVDIYHAHDVSGLPACYIAALLRRKPLIFDAHELPLAELSSSLFQRMRPLLKLLLVGLLARCAGVITVSPPIVEEIRNRYHASNVVLVRNIPPYQALPKSDRLQKYLGSGSDVRIALYQGNLSAGRGLDRLIRAAAFLEHNIVIVMMGQGEMEVQLKALIASEGVADRVKLLPPAPYAELLDWTTSADLGLMVYSLDHSQNVLMCLPNKLFEYLMAGLPVLASPLEAVADVIKSYEVGQIISSLTPRDIGVAINELLADHQAYASMRRNALQASQQDLCWEKEKSGLIDLYSKIPGLRAADRSFSSISYVETENQAKRRGIEPELARLEAEYARRASCGDYAARYSYFNEATLHRVHSLERNLLALLKRHKFTPLSEKKILDLGCGSGGFLRRFLDYGASPENLSGIDLMGQRIEQAKHLHPGLDWRVGSAHELPYANASFDLVMSFVVFSSILDESLRQRIVDEMWRVLKPGGLLLLYDFTYSNPANAAVTGVSLHKVKQLFSRPGVRFDFRRITLAPPIARVVAPRANWLAYILEQCKVLNTHTIGIISKEEEEIPVVKERGSTS